LISVFLPIISVNKAIFKKLGQKKEAECKKVLCTYENFACEKLRRFPLFESDGVETEGKKRNRLVFANLRETRKTPQFAPSF